MIAAIYSRKSTEQHVADDQKSVARQIAHAREYAQRKGWTVNDALIFVDDGISGAEFANRPGFVRLMSSLKPQPPFQFLIMSEESRLGREAIETAYALKQLVTAGVRVFFYLEDRERTLDSPTDKILLSLTAFADELEREKARQRVTDAMVRKAKAGHVTGGKCFGYKNVEILGANGTRSHVERRIVEPEAAVVRRIFELAAAGTGQNRIAILLNDDGVPSPRPQCGRPAGWAPSSVHAVLFRELYRGVIVWNRTRKRNRWGEHRAANRPENEWLRVPARSLRIVSDELWRAAHSRIDAARTLYRDATKGLRGGRPRVDSKYLLPGLARCARCNGGLLVRSGGHGSGSKRTRAFVYACSSNHNRGRAVCSNHIAVSMDAVDQEVIRALHDDVLTPDIIEDVIARVRQILNGEQRANDRDAARKELARIEQQIANLSDSIAIGGNLPALVERLQAAYAKRDTLLQNIATNRSTRLDWADIERRARRKLANWRGLLGRNSAEARTVLRELLEGEPLRVTPIENGKIRGFRFEGSIVVGGLIQGFVPDQWQVASLTGFEPVLPP